MFRPIVFSVTCIAMCVGHHLQAANQWKASEGGNDHFYQAFAAPGGIKWSEAAAGANELGGYLATILSSAENEFVNGLVEGEDLWRNDHQGPWLGGSQPPGSAEPDGGWEWSNGDGGFGAEDVGAFTNWCSTEPNNSGAAWPEDSLHLLYPSETCWNDELGDRSATPDFPLAVVAYIVEWNMAPEIGACEAGLLGDLIRDAGALCSGDKSFSDFQYHSTGDMPPADRINVIPIEDEQGNFGVRFQSAFLDLCSFC